MKLTRGMWTAAVLMLGLAACDRPGPLSAAARGTYPPPPPAPAWAASLAGRRVQESFPNAETCVGFVDGLADRYKGARKAGGWAWNASRAQPLQRLAVVGADGRMVGFGEGGLARPDVPAARPDVASGATGWWLIAPAAERSYTVYGLDTATHAACVVGVLRL